MEDLGDPPTTAYWLAWATAFLLIIAVVSAGVMNISGDGSEDGFVSAAGRTSGTLEFATTTTSSTVPPAPTTTTRRPAATTSTTLPKAASAVLRAIGTTAPPTTAAPVTTTIAPPVTTTPTTAPPTTTTTTTLPPRAMVTVANEYTRAVVITVNGRTFTLDPSSEAQPVPLDVPPNVNDVIEGHVVADPQCQVGGVGDLFQAGGRYRVAVVTGPNTCGDFASVELRVTSI